MIKIELHFYNTDDDFYEDCNSLLACSSIADALYRSSHASTHIAAVVYGDVGGITHKFTVGELHSQRTTLAQGRGDKVITLYAPDADFEKCLNQFTEKFAAYDYEFFTKNCADQVNFVLDHLFPPSRQSQVLTTAVKFAGLFACSHKAIPAPPGIQTPTETFAKAESLFLKYGHQPKTLAMEKFGPEEMRMTPDDIKESRREPKTVSIYIRHESENNRTLSMRHVYNFRDYKHDRGSHIVYADDDNYSLHIESGGRKKIRPPYAKQWTTYEADSSNVVEQDIAEIADCFLVRPSSEAGCFPTNRQSLNTPQPPPKVKADPASRGYSGASKSSSAAVNKHRFMPPTSKARATETSALNPGRNHKGYSALE